MEIQRIMKEYYDQLYNHKFENPDETDQLLGIHKLPKVTQEEINSLNSSLSIKEIKVIFSNNMTARRGW